MRAHKYLIINSISLLLCAFLLFAMFSGNGWFSGENHKSADSDSIAVEEPPILYILDSDAENITQLSLSGLEIGVEKQIVFCVSSVYPVLSDNKGHKISFDLELVNTRNLNAVFNLYTADIVDENTPGAVPYYSQQDVLGYFVEGSALQYTEADTSGNMAAYGADFMDAQQLNRAAYKKYLSTTDSESPNFNLRFIDNGGELLYDTSKCRFFILKITWDETQISASVDPKETDMVYILARGGRAT